MTNILETQTLSKIYQSGDLTVKAVDDASMAIRAGEFAALVGPSGSGKTTMLAMLAALLAPTEGSIKIDGQDLAGMKERDKVRFRRHNIGFTFQANNLVPYLNVRENVDLMLRLNGQRSKGDRAHTAELLDRLGLGDRMDTMPDQLSGGQRQRVAIARALIHEPSLVLADEPTASLDTERAYQVVGIFADLIHESRRAGIMVTHDLRMVRFVDKVIQMEDGKIVSVLEDREQIDALAGAGLMTAQTRQPAPMPAVQPIPVPAAPMGIPVPVAGDLKFAAGQIS
ncbi:MAG: ABC transporter ATP-binding protein [Anaerolineales bacterium]|nr:ABC transporter ATP-binding protein [Anaerolineales bacterium]